MLEGAPSLENIEREFTARVDEGYFDELIRFLSKGGMNTFKEILRTEVVDEDLISTVAVEDLDEVEETINAEVAFAPEASESVLHALMTKIEAGNVAVERGREALKTNPLYLEKYRSGELSLA